MISLYQWLQDKKNYTREEADETIDRYDNGMEIPDSIKNDIKEYTMEYIQKYYDKK